MLRETPTYDDLPEVDESATNALNKIFTKAGMEIPKMEKPKPEAGGGGDLINKPPVANDSEDMPPKKESADRNNPEINAFTNSSMPSFEQSPANKSNEALVSDFLQDHGDVIDSKGFTLITVKEIYLAYLNNPETAKEYAEKHPDSRALEIFEFITQLEPDDKPPSPLAPGGIQLHNVVLGQNKPENENAEEDTSGRMAA
jgi:hypothetical protein